MAPEKFLERKSEFIQRCSNPTEGNVAKFQTTRMQSVASDVWLLLKVEEPSESLDQGQRSCKLSLLFGMLTAKFNELQNLQT